MKRANRWLLYGPLLVAALILAGWRVAAFMGAGVLLGAQAGASLSMRMHSDPIRRILAVAVTVFALSLFVRHFLV